MTSIYTEYLFCEYDAIHDEDLTNHDIDIYIDGIPYDVKLTVYPVELNNHPYNLKTRQDKNAMISWYYKHQSQQTRKQMLNRIYIVCDAHSQRGKLKMKSDFDLIRTKVQTFMQHVEQNDMNKIEIPDEGKKYRLKSDIVYISYE